VGFAFRVRMKMNMGSTAVRMGVHMYPSSPTIVERSQAQSNQHHPYGALEGQFHEGWDAKL